MTRRALDLLGGAICVLIAVVLLVVGLKARSLGSFAHDNVRASLEEQKVAFPPAEELSPEEAAQPGVAKYAGQQVNDGDKARVYADEFIALHLRSIAEGRTYSEVSAAAQADPDDPRLQGQAQALFRGETLRGLLKQAYAFGRMGDEASAIAPWLLAGAALLALLGVGGLWHGLKQSDRPTSRRVGVAG